MLLGDDVVAQAPEHAAAGPLTAITEETLRRLRITLPSRPGVTALVIGQW